MNLDFYLVKYDEIGGIICQRIGDLSAYSPAVFWTSEPMLMQSPFCPEEEHIYDGREHIQPLAAEDDRRCHPPVTGIEVVSHILHMNSSCNIIVPGLLGYADLHNGEGRIWRYTNGTFGFGFLNDHFIIDLKHVFQDGCLLDSVTTIQ